MGADTVVVVIAGVPSWVTPFLAGCSVVIAMLLVMVLAKNAR